MGGTISKGLGAITGGAIGSGIGSLAFGPVGAAAGGVLGAIGGGGIFNSKSPSVPSISGQSPVQILQQSGGAPLLTSIALGVNPNDAIASYFGINPTDYKSWKAQLSPSEQESISGLENTLGQVSSNTDLKTKAVNQLVNDFPNFMADAIPKYTGIMDQQTQAAAQKALSSVGAKYAAGGQLSSGATEAALARTGAETEQGNLALGGNLALQDWTQRFNQASALQSFQQKMLGQGATQGFNAIQNALQRNQQGQEFNAGISEQQQQTQQAQSGAMWGALGSLGGTALGYTLGGPIGARLGGQAGGTFARMVNPSSNAMAGQGA